MNNKSKIRFIAVLILFLTMPLAYATPPGFPGDVDDETPTSPIDGFIGVAIAAGAVYGIRKLRQNK
ncbi:hypothetical protein GGR32_001766 [Mesonia hippocampi]|uniref:Uncharacterized protein n=1 Tax=Mesonia hippocampi TaxID=1628250 RepID=A0A840EMX2_9FLAO|nr:hypothetical protein [Mesonia hippocampi]MBB4119468.1 hypothetical protein [Mesonia hippocampi]